MPELPEVEVVRRGLAPHVLGRPIRRVEVRHPRPVRRHLAGADDFAALLTGRTFTGARRRGSTSGCRSRTATPCRPTSA